MIKCIALMCFWMGVVDIIEDDTMTVELTSAADETINLTWDVKSFPCTLTEGGKFVLTVSGKSRESKVWCNETKNR